MAEFGAVAAIIQVADSGLRLSTMLFTLAETVASADKTISSISKDVSLTSVVLKELANILKQDEGPRAYSDTTIQSAIAVVNECSKSFEELHSILIEKLPKHSSRRGDEVSRTTLALERFKWPYLQPKINALQSNIDRLKSSLLVILNIISLAKMMKTEPPSADIGQMDLVKDLIKSNQEHVRRYEELKHRIPNKSTKDGPDPLVNAILQELSVVSTPTEICRSEHETKLHCLGYFTLLFENLRNEISSPCYKIGSQSRFRIERHILSARASEIRWLYKVHGEAAVRDVWQAMEESQVAVMPDSAGHESYTRSTLNKGGFDMVSSKKRKARSQDPNVERPPGDDEVIGRDLVLASGEESKSWFIASDSTDEEHDLKALQPRRPPLESGLDPLSSQLSSLQRSYSFNLPLSQPHSTAELQPKASRAQQATPQAVQPEHKRKRNDIIAELSAESASTFDAGEIINFVSKDYNTGDTKLDELLRLWTPATAPAQGPKVQKIKKRPIKKSTI